jgi:diguanylate cyclase (GGDEF)-like protein
MTAAQQRRASSRLLARIAIGGMSLAVLALGALAVWAAIVTQNGAQGLSRAGVQTSGHLRATQALSIIDTSSDNLEKEIIPSELRKLRRAQRVLDDALGRMQHGGVREASRIADEARPLMAQLKPAIQEFLARPPGYDSNGNSGAEERMENVMGRLQEVLNDLDPDPSQLLTTQLEDVTATEHTVRGTAFVLIPLGLGGVAACGWLLGLYRRRSEAAMRVSIDATAVEARTDQLTTLPNRRALMEELEQRTTARQDLTLAVADLNGFKRYNDTFGHPAGDALLRRLGLKLAAACEGRGIAARIGGDEFCVLLFSAVAAHETRTLVREALRDEGEGFRITAAVGVAALSQDACDPEAALCLADARMYAAKVSAHPSAEDGMFVVLTRMLDERHPGLGGHVEEVASLAVDCAVALGLSADDAASVKRAAELHDLGKVAIPTAILSKNGPLNEEEWTFMRRHSVIGERILAGVPTLEGAASLVRSSHERWDGGGYPDGLVADEIPIGARIICVADAYCAMTEDRVYAQARSVQSARQELRDCSGSQFDPAVVTAFLAALDSRDARMKAQASLAPVLT